MVKGILSKSSIVVMLGGSLFASNIHAYFADEHNSGNGVGNKILEFDIQKMKLVNSIDVPGNKGHHADRSFHSKIYGIPKESNYINVIKLSRNSFNETSMKLVKQIKLIHRPRSADAYNKELDLILLTAKNRPMGTLIDAKNDKIVATIGQDMDCKLTDGSMLLSHSDANTPEGALKYQCTYNQDFGGDQISGHPYWLTPNYAAIVDRSNKLISLYHIWKEDGEVKTEYVNSVRTTTSIHQIIPRDRTNLPLDEQADFYAVEEGHPKSGDDYGIPPSLIKLKLTKSGLKYVKKMPLAREVAAKDMDKLIQNSCKEIYNRFNLFNMFMGSRYSKELKYEAYKNFFDSIDVPSYEYDSKDVDLPVACMNANLSGGHNADFKVGFGPDSNKLFVGTADGYMHIIDVRDWKIVNNISTGGIKGIQSGSGHTCFAPKKNLAIVTNHQANYQTVIDLKTNTKIKDIYLPFKRAGIFGATQSHTCYVDKDNKYYYNAWTDGGVFYRIDLDRLRLDKYVKVGGIPIQGNFISIDSLEVNDDIDSSKIIVNSDKVTAYSNSNKIFDILENDEGDNLELISIDSSKCGSANKDGNKLNFKAGSRSCKEKLNYSVKDNSGNISKGTIDITVKRVKKTRLRTKYDRYNIDIDSVKTLDVLGNDKGDDLVITDVTKPRCGSAKVISNKIYYKAGDKRCRDRFYYEVKDRYGNTKEGRVILKVVKGD